MSSLDLDAIEARAIEALQRMDGSEGVVECNTPGLRAIAKASYALSADIPALVARVREHVATTREATLLGALAEIARADTLEEARAIAEAHLEEAR